MQSIFINNRKYNIPTKPIIVICIDGSDEKYLNAALSVGYIPTIKKFIQEGTFRLANSVIPSFTNPNNVSIVTGAPPSIHGICGNYFFDPLTQEEVMMNDIKFLRSETIFKKMLEKNKKVAIVTAKDKLRALLGAGLKIDPKNAICFSAEKADKTNLIENGIANASKWLDIPVPQVYSSKLSEFVLASGLKLMSEWKPDIMYLTTTDFIQHKFSPEDKEALNFYKMLDKYIHKLNSFGATILITADHGMNSKHNKDGDPNVIFIQDYLDDWIGALNSRVILPITDPYVVHHGSLGSYATIYLENSNDIQIVFNKIKKLDEIEFVFTRSEAMKKFNLPFDRIGDLVVISSKNTVIGKNESYHNLNALKEPLRSHGGISEQKVPFILNAKFDLPISENLNNYDAFFYAIAAEKKIKTL